MNCFRKTTKMPRMKGKAPPTDQRRMKKGTKHSQTTRKKMSKAREGKTPWNKGMKFSYKSRPTMKGKNSWNKGQNNCYSKETIEKMRVAKVGKIGENASNWKGGITPENERIRHSIEYDLWREAVFARDNWICQKYGIKGGKLHSHHILNFAQYPELRFAINNGITLSDKAHKEFHKKYGRKNNTREQLKEFLKNAEANILARNFIQSELKNLQKQIEEAVGEDDKKTGSGSESEAIYWESGYNEAKKEIRPRLKEIFKEYGIKS